MVSLTLTDSWSLTDSKKLSIDSTYRTYGDLTDAQKYFDKHLDSDPWDQATSKKRNKALVQATLAIDKLNFRGFKASSSQERQFPRGNDTEVPTDIKLATYELALSLLDGVDLNLEVENLSFSNAQFGEIRQQRKYLPDHILAGIPNIVSWSYLVPYLRDPNIIRRLRIS